MLGVEFRYSKHNVSKIEWTECILTYLYSPSYARHSIKQKKALKSKTKQYIIHHKNHIKRQKITQSKEKYKVIE